MRFIQCFQRVEGYSAGPKYEYISLGYIASGSDERLDAVQVALDAEKAAIEAAEREKNKNNTDGL